MLTDISRNYLDLFNAAETQLPFMAYLLFIVWGINICDWLMRSPLRIFGIYPRSLWGLIGIFTSPFIHANFTHLFFNTIPFFVLGMFILALGKSLFIGVTVVLAIMQGLLVWLFGRKYLHIGASGVISGYFGFILGLAYLYPTIISLILAFVALYYFGSIIAGILPTSELISWEAHLFGLISGLVLVFVLWSNPYYEQRLIFFFS